MLDNALTAGSPDWWLLRLGTKLADDQKRCDLLESYWEGHPPLPFGNIKMRQAYKRLQRMSRTNFALLLVESVVERLAVVGFRAGGEVTDQVDRDAWLQWQANGLDADSTLVHRAALIMSRSYCIVGEQEKSPGDPLVTVEDPRQVIHESDPTNRRKVIAALKTWQDDIVGKQLAVLYLPDELWYYSAKRKPSESSSSTSDVWQAGSWELDTSQYAEGWAHNPFGEVPVVPFVNRPGIDGCGIGEFEDCIDILDRINTGILDRAVTSAMQAYRQRWATGVSMTDESGNPINDWDPGADLIWTVEDENVKFGEFQPTDLTPMVKAIESDVSYLGAVSRTPPSYLLAAIVNASGDALAAAEVGLVSKCFERSIEFGESWESVYRLMAQVQGNKVDNDATVLWRDPQFRSLGELAAANVQLMTAGVPWRTRMVALNYTPAEIDRMEVERAADAALSSSLAPLAVAEGGQVGSRGVAFTGAGPENLGDTAMVIPKPGPVPPLSP